MPAQMLLELLMDLKGHFGLNGIHVTLDTLLAASDAPGDDLLAVAALVRAGNLGLRKTGCGAKGSVICYLK